MGWKTVSRRVLACPSACATRNTDVEEGDLAEVNPLAGLAHMPHLREAPLLPSLRPPALSVKSANEEETEGAPEEPEVPRPGG